MTMFRTNPGCLYETTTVRSIPLKTPPRGHCNDCSMATSHPWRNSRSVCTTSTTVYTSQSSSNGSFGDDPISPDRSDDCREYYNAQDDDEDDVCQTGGCFGAWINRFSPPSRAPKDAFSPADSDSFRSANQHDKRQHQSKVDDACLSPTKLELTLNIFDDDITDGLSCSSTSCPSESTCDVSQSLVQQEGSSSMLTLEIILSKASKAEEDCDTNSAIAHLENYLYQIEQQPNLSLEFRRASALHKLGCLQWQCGRYQLSLCALIEASAAYDTLIKDSSSFALPSVLLASANVLLSIGRLHLSRGEGAAAMQCYRECVQRLSSIQRSCDQSQSARLFAQACIGAGRVLLAQGKLNSALKRLKRALKVQLGREIPEDVASISLHSACVPLQDIAETLSYLGMLHEEQSHFDKAMKCYAKALQTYSVSLGPNHVDVGEVSNKLGRILHKLGRFSDAGQAIRRAHQIFLNNLGEHHRNTSAALLNLGMLYASQGKHKRAQAIYYKVLKVQQATFNGEVHADLALTFHCIAANYEAAFKLDKAIQYYNQELMVLQTTLHPYHLDIAKLLHHMAMHTMDVVDNQGNYFMLNESIEWLEEAADIFQHHNQANTFQKEMLSLTASIHKLHRRQSRQSMT